MTAHRHWRHCSGGSVEYFYATRGVDVIGLEGDLAVAKVLHDFEDFGPTREGPFVDLLVLIDGHNELEQLASDFPLFGRPTNFSTTPARTAATVHADASLHVPGSLVPAGVRDAMGS